MNEVGGVGTCGRWAEVSFTELPRAANVGHIFCGTLCGFPARQSWRLIFNGIWSAFQWQEVKRKRYDWLISQRSIKAELSWTNL